MCPFLAYLRLPSDPNGGNILVLSFLACQASGVILCLLSAVLALASDTASLWLSKYIFHEYGSIWKLIVVFLPRTKALLFALVRAFEFELAVPPEHIKKKSAVVQRPVVQPGEKKDGKTGMPLIIKPYRPS